MNNLGDRSDVNNDQVIFPNWVFQLNCFDIFSPVLLFLSNMLKSKSEAKLKKNCII